MWSPTGHDAVGGACVLHLEHHALVRLVGRRKGFADEAVETRSLEEAEPSAGLLHVGSDLREVDRSTCMHESLLEALATYAEGLGHQVVVAEGQEVERHE